MPAAARTGDACFPHCGVIPHFISSGSGDVVVNGRGFARVGDTVTAHLNPRARCKSVHKSIITSGSKTVVVNGRPAATLGSGLLLCTFVVSGSSDVVVG